MRAIVCTRYGPPEVLELRDVPKPLPGKREVSIRIHATAVTASDSIIRGFRLPRTSPMYYMMGVVVGFGRPRSPILGLVVAGEVESLGAGVTALRTGDRVFGVTLRSGLAPRFGGYAEYVCLPESGPILPMPSSVTYEEAAALPYGGLMALHFLRKANIGSGQRVLIYGASGANGTAAVQLARHFGARVTAACGPANLDLVKALGADDVIDYTSESAAPAEAYDLVFDAVGRRKDSELKRALTGSLTAGGRLVSVDDGRPLLTRENLALLKELVEAGEFRAVIDRTYRLDQMVEAHRYVDAGHKRGNVVITVG